MRDIQFRIWCSDNGDAPKMVYLDKMELDNGLWFHNPEEHTSDIHELMQYTGLKDKNGKEIWEGDVLNVIDCELVGYNQNEYGESEIYADSKGKVHYVGGAFCFDGHSSGDLSLDTFGEDALEVIGNIYEHSHLLK